MLREITEHAFSLLSDGTRLNGGTGSVSRAETIMLAV
jgi:hypothetical protein